MLAIVAVASLAVACSKKQDAAPASGSAAAGSAAPKAADPSKLDIAVTDKGFEPDNVEVSAGKPVTLVFTRKTDDTCIKQVVLTMDDGKKVLKDLPLNTPVELAATFPKPGKLGFACGMDMMKGTVVVR